MAATTRTKKRKLKKKRIIIALIILVAFICASSFGIYKLLFNKKETKTVATVTVFNCLQPYPVGYSKQLFGKLKKELSKDSVDEEKYATLETQIFISEFFTLFNKVNRSDVGGIQFVYKDYQESFTKLAMEGMYHYVENNIYGDRKQELPEVVNVDVINTEQKEYILSDDVTDEKAYYVDVTINYAKDLGYQQSATIVLIHNGKRLDIVKMTEK